MIGLLLRNIVVRKLGIRVLKIFAFDFRMTNPWTGDRFFLNSFLHKGYWFKGKSREAATMRAFAKIVKPGDTVIEVGGHIGFISQYFAMLAGRGGQVIVFEPGSNNLKYLYKNTEKLGSIDVKELGVSDRNGYAKFFEDNITGQNNSLLEDYKNLNGVQKTHGINAVKNEREISLTTLDAYVGQGRCDFIKMDIEGNEYKALLGAQKTLAKVRAIMVEITENQQDCFSLLENAGFGIFDEDMKKMESIDSEFSGNIFGLRNVENC